MQTKHNIQLQKHIDKAESVLSRTEKKICADLTLKLRKKYKGKIVKCKCFDACVEGDDYYFNQELKDICAYSDGKGGFSVHATFLYKSPFSNPEDKAKDTSFHLESIEEVK